MERKSVLTARPGQLLPYLSEDDHPIRRRFRNASGQDQSSALMICNTGVWDCALKRVIKEGPVSVPWTEYYQEQVRVGGLKVVESRPRPAAEPAPVIASAHKRAQRAGSDD